MKSERERKIPYEITYVWNLKYDTNELICKTERLADIEKRLVIAKKEGARVREGYVGSLGLADANYYI